MSEKDSDPKDVIDSYRRRQQTAKRAPLLLVVAAVLLIVGAAVVIFWLFSPEIPGLALFASETPTPTTTSTVTPTVTSSVTPTVTPTETVVPTETLTPTPSGPFIYEVVEGDSCFSIADQFDVGILVLISINNLDPTCPIQVGDKLTIPGPDTELPTPTPFPDDLPRGTKIEYMVQFGDSLAAIAIKFNSTVEAIKEENEIENENEIFVGQVLIIPVNLVTPVPTNTPGNETQTPTPGG